MVETNAAVFICAPLLSRQPAIISQKSSQCCHCTDVYLTLSGGIERLADLAEVGMGIRLL